MGHGDGHSAAEVRACLCPVTAAIIQTPCWTATILAYTTQLGVLCYLLTCHRGPGLQIWMFKLMNLNNLKDALL